jgi:hypothetical protein
MDRSSLEEGRKLINSNLAIAESNLAMKAATEKSSDELANSIALVSLGISNLLTATLTISETLKDLVKVLTPTPIKEPVVEPIEVPVG